MPKSDIPIETLIQNLHSEDWTTRCDAARLLGQSRDPRAVEALLPDLNDPNWRVRRNAAQALGALRNKRAVQPLIQSLDDRIATVRQRAAVALGRIKDPEALPFLLDLIVENKNTSHEAFQAIRKFGKKALPEIVKAHEKSGNPTLASLLVELKYEGSVDILIELLESPDLPTRAETIQDLGRLGDKRAVPHLMRELNKNDPMTQAEVIRALGQLRAEETIPFLLDMLLDDDLYSPRSGIYHAITEAFQSISGIDREIESAFRGKFPAMSIGGTPTSLPEVMSMLGKEHLQQLNDMLSNLENKSMQIPGTANIPGEVFRKAAEETAWKFGVMFADAKDAREDRVKRLLELLKSDSNLQRAAAALSLPWYTDEASLDALKQATQDQDEIVRAAARWAFNTLQKTIEYRRRLGM